MTIEDTLVKAVRPLVERGILAAIKDGNLEAALDKTLDAFLVNYDSQAVGYYEDMLDEVCGAGHLPLEVVRRVRRHAFKQRDSAPINPPISRSAVRDKEMSALLDKVVRVWDTHCPFYIQQSSINPKMFYVVSLVGPCIDTIGGEDTRRVNVMGKIVTVSAAGERRSMVLKDLPGDRMVKVQSFDDPATYRTYWVWAILAEDGDELKMWMSVQLDPRQDSRAIEGNGGRQWKELSCARIIFNQSERGGYRLTEGGPLVGALAAETP